MQVHRFSTPSLWLSGDLFPSPATTLCSKSSCFVPVWVISKNCGLHWCRKRESKNSFSPLVTTVNRMLSSSPSSMVSPLCMLPLSSTPSSASEQGRDSTLVFLGNLHNLSNLSYCMTLSWLKVGTLCKGAFRGFHAFPSVLLHRPNFVLHMLLIFNAEKADVNS